MRHVLTLPALPSLFLSKNPARQQFPCQQALIFISSYLNLVNTLLFFIFSTPSSSASFAFLFWALYQNTFFKSPVSITFHAFLGRNVRRDSVEPRREWNNTESRKKCQPEWVRNLYRYAIFSYEIQRYGKLPYSVYKIHAYSPGSASTKYGLLGSSVPLVYDEDDERAHLRKYKV